MNSAKGSSKGKNKKLSFPMIQCGADPFSQRPRFTRFPCHCPALLDEFIDTGGKVLKKADDAKDLESLLFKSHCRSMLSSSALRGQKRLLAQVSTVSGVSRRAVADLIGTHTEFKTIFDKLNQLQAESMQWDAPPSASKPQAFHLDTLSLRASGSSKRIVGNYCGI